MSISCETAMEILGVPSYATVHDITLRYLSLVVRSVPESHSNIEDLRYITLAFLTLVFPEKKFDLCMSLGEMYGIFQSFFNGWKLYCDEFPNNKGSSKYDSEVVEDSEEERKADDKAVELILEEEKEKRKAERKKAKKKRRKEKKKLNKTEQDTKSNNSAPNAKKVKEQRVSSNDSSSNEDEDEILARRVEKKGSKTEKKTDPSSGFVACIAGNRWINLPAPTVINEDEDAPVQEPNSVLENQELTMIKSRQFALLGNEKASLGEYAEAILLFSEAIKLNPADHRFYGNRSYCYEHICEYERALKDADKSITLCPTWPKNYFRKGKALLGLKRYQLAEECFLQVLKYDSDCEDALSHLHTVKILQITERGYSFNEAEAALSKYGSVKEALIGLLKGDFAKVSVSEVDVFLSDDDCEDFWTPVSKTKQAVEDYNIKKDPRNPEKHNSIWIGNVQSTVTENMITSLFSKYGELISVKVMSEKYCAFVNYKSKASPGKAMAALQGYNLHGGYLDIRFPNLPGETKPKKKKAVIQVEQGKSGQGPVNGNECYFWRTTGCTYESQCRFQHIKAHKGIDKQKWMEP